MLAPVPTFAPAAPVSEIVESSLTVFAWPSGQVAGSADALIGRFTSNVVVQSWQRNSYVGTGPLCTAASVIFRASS